MGAKSNIFFAKPAEHVIMLAHKSFVSSLGFMCAETHENML